MRQILLIAFLSISIYSFGQPDWVNYSAINEIYPEDDYLVGFSSLERKNEPLIEALDNLSEFAIMNLAESLFLDVVTVAAGGADSEYFSPKSISREQLYEGGMKLDTYYDSLKQIAYVIAYLKKKELVKPIYLELSNALKEVRDGLNAMPEEAPELDELSRLSSLLLLAQSRSEVLPILGVTNEVVLKTDQINLYDNLLSEKVGKAKTSSNLTIEDRLKVMVQAIIKDSKIKSFQLMPVTYKNTELVSPLSEYLGDKLTELLPQNGVTLVEQSSIKLISSYWLKDENLLVAFSIKQYDGDEIVKVFASESVFMPKSELLEKGLVFFPDERHVSRVKSEFLLSKMNGGVQVGLTTQEGDRMLVFETGDKLNLYVNASRPVFITLLNIWDDGTQVLMMENYYVGKDQINQPIALPFSWDVKCPCGTEYIKLIAEKNPMLPMEVEKDSNGFKVVQKDFNQNIEGIRSRQLDLQKNQKDYYFGEAHLVITTTL